MLTTLKLPAVIDNTVSRVLIPSQKGSPKSPFWRGRQEGPWRVLGGVRGWERFGNALDVFSKHLEPSGGRLRGFLKAFRAIWEAFRRPPETSVLDSLLVSTGSHKCAYISIDWNGYECGKDG